MIVVFFGDLYLKPAGHDEFGQLLDGWQKVLLHLLGGTMQRVQFLAAGEVNQVEGSAGLAHPSTD